ncbi:hypothetical protein BGZ74_000246 [Mortierella antarctica]|nr:hypothetical protein BGZ74_000246 [Mortierella antarctica]KAG0353685.1 hypothetical protein BG005_007065 [Podila minutissima]
MDSDNNRSGNAISMETMETGDMAMALRQRSLLFWLHASTNSCPAKILIPDSRPVLGTFIATDAQEHRVRIDALQTPLGTYEHVVLRGSDIDAIELSFDKSST